MTMHLLSEIERYLRRTGITATRFGREAARDPRLVHDLRRGREAGGRMTQRVRAYLTGEK
jgi:2,4-dienoyl-CoA reductase-like NADH-dependent reductase (Old Yellow Enzyme family)